MIVRDERLLKILTSFVLDTACSSSLYGLHLACAALDAGECDAAIVAAANLIQTPEQHIGTMKAGVLSETGTCHTFDESADGYGRADGVGALYLKKLSKAIADGDPIRSVIRGTATNRYVVATLTFFGGTSLIGLLAMAVPRVSRFPAVTAKRRSFEKLTKRPD